MATVVKPPRKVKWDKRKSVFLAGTIDNGQSTDWQASVEKSLSDLDVLILNPRRKKWNPTLQQSIKNPKFKKQVEWELDGLDRVTQIFMHFAPGSKSPITLLELGLYIAKGNIIIVCPQGFWRRGNIEVITDRYTIPLYESIEEGILVLREKLQIFRSENSDNHSTQG